MRCHLSLQSLDSAGRLAAPMSTSSVYIVPLRAAGLKCSAAILLIGSVLLAAIGLAGVCLAPWGQQVPDMCCMSPDNGARPGAFPIGRATANTQASPLPIFENLRPAGTRPGGNFSWISASVSPTRT
jgi:hypothetical protein